jgi:aspartokinase-like uncharacterized kinase
MVDAVVKVGGSLAKSNSTLRKLAETLGQLSQKHRLIVVGGGGFFADAVRNFDQMLNLHPKTSHKMAILAMDQYGLALAELIPGATTTYLLENALTLAHSMKPVVFLPSKFMFKHEPLTPSWEVTSDTIAAHIAYSLKAGKVILLKDVDGIFDKDPKKFRDANLIPKLSSGQLKRLSKKVVDSQLAGLLIKSRLKCYVINGKQPERLSALLNGTTTTSTEIIT